MADDVKTANPAPQDADHQSQHPEEKNSEAGEAKTRDAGQDPSIRERLKRHPDDPDAKLDEGLDESMDASDPPALTNPHASSEPAPSSGFDEKAEARRKR